MQSDRRRDRWSRHLKWSSRARVRAGVVLAVVVHASCRWRSSSGRVRRRDPGSRGSRPRVRLLTSPSAGPDHRLTLEAVAAERGAGRVDLDALQLALNPGGTGGTAPDLRPEPSLPARKFVRSDSPGGPRWRPSASAADLVSRDLKSGRPARAGRPVSVQGAVRRRSSLRVHHVVAGVRDLDNSVSRSLAGIESARRPDDFGKHRHRSADVRRNLARATEANAKTLTSTPQRPHTQRIPSALAHHPSPFVAEKNSSLSCPAFQPESDYLRAVIRANITAQELHRRAESCLQLLEGRSVVKRRKGQDLLQNRRAGRAFDRHRPALPGWSFP